MPIGGGSFTVQNKVLPGAYINFVSMGTNAKMGERGVAALPLELNWGPEDQVFKLDAADFNATSLKVFGYDPTDANILLVREAMKRAKTLLIYRVNGGGTKASATVGGMTVTAKYGGTRGNAIKVAVITNVDDATKADVVTYRKNGAGGWVLKCDVRKYFYRINHDVLKTQLRRLIKDRDVLWLLDMIIDSTEGPGIPIGNHTSQWFAILYLSDMDHMIKERLGIKYYGRYMDDFYLIHEDRAYLQFCLEEIRRFLVPLGLELNQKTAIFPLSQGIDFLGFRTYLTDSGKVVRKVRRESKNRIRRKITKFRHLVDEGRVDFDTVLQSYNSWTGHAEHGNSYHLISEIDDLFFNLFREEMEGKPYGEISIRFARWKRRQVGEHKVQRTGDQVDRRHTGHVPGPNGPGDGKDDHPEMLRREGAEQQQQ